MIDGIKSSERRVGDVVVLELEGRLALGNHNLLEVIGDLVDRGEKHILVDLDYVRYMDSTSVGDLVVGYTTATKSGAELKLLNVPAKIVDLLTIHHLIDVFERYSDETEAVGSFIS